VGDIVLGGGELLPRDDDGEAEKRAKDEPTTVRNGESVELFSLPTEGSSVRSASNTLPTATAIDTTTTPASDNQRPSTLNSLTSLPPMPSVDLRHTQLAQAVQ
jgi:hypothetical protein